jgi:hypothetical protein
MHRFPVLVFLCISLMAACDSGSSEDENGGLPDFAVNGSWLQMEVNGSAVTSAGEVTATVFTTSGGLAFWVSIEGVGLPRPPAIVRAFLLTATLDEGFVAPEDYAVSVRYLEAMSAEEEMVFVGEGAQVRIAITERTEDVVRGTFSGTLVKEDGTETITVEEGTFVANIEEIRALPIGGSS